mgnify:FL=1
MTVTCKASKAVILAKGGISWTAAPWGAAYIQALLTANWSVPLQIISDRDPRSTSDLWQEMWRQLGTTLLITTAHGPQSDNQSERTNQTIEIAIRFFVIDNSEKS